MYSRFTVNLDSAKKRYETLEGRQHVVVPAAILGEGVWEGSGGPVLYRNEELQRWISTWNHRPMVVYHPTKDNKPISASDQSVLNARKVGITLNAKHDDKSRTECWFDVERTRTVDNRILMAIENGQPIEVSTGLELDLKGGEGEWNGTKHIGEAVNHRPDHLAILPDQKGAYSVKSGGGIYANSGIKDAEKLPESLQSVLFRSLQNGANILTNELSFSDIASQLSELLSAKYGEPGKYWQGYLCEIYETYLVFDDKGKKWMVGYKVSDDTVSLDGEAQEVERVTEYKVVNGGPTYVRAGGQLTLKEREMEMAGTFDRKAHLTSLIGNGYEESDRAWMDNMDDAVLSRIKPVKTVTVNTEKVETKLDPPKKFFVQNADGTYTEAALQPTQVKQASLAELVQNSGDPAVKAQFAAIQRQFQAQKEGLVANILSNPNNRFTKEWLESQNDLDLLQGIAAAGGPGQVQNSQPSMLQPVFFGNAGGFPHQAQTLPTEVLAPIDTHFESVLKK